MNWKALREEKPCVSISSLLIIHPQGCATGINSALEQRSGEKKSINGENEVKEFDKLQLWLWFIKGDIGGA